MKPELTKLNIIEIDGHIYYPIKKYNRKKGTSVYNYNPWNWDTNEGDFMITSEGKLMRLEKSRSPSNRTADQLGTRTIYPPNSDLVAININGEIWWAKKKQKET